MEEGERQAEGLASSDRLEPAEVALHSQVLTPRQHKVIKIASFLMMVLSAFAFCYSIVFKSTAVEVLIAVGSVQMVNISFASLNILVLGFLLAIYVHNLLLVRRAQLRWPRRRRVLVRISLALLCIQLLNSIFYLVPNAASLASPCSWYRPIELPCAFIRWTCWNTLFCLFNTHTHNIMPLKDRQGRLRRRAVEGRQAPVLAMDAGWARHLPQLTVWVLMQTSIVFLVAYAPSDFGFTVRVVPATAPRPCRSREYACETQLVNGATTSFWIFLIMVYAVMIQVFLRITRRRLLLAPYKDLAEVHLMILQQKSQMAWVAALGVLQVPALWYSRWDRCNNFFVVWLGLLPLQTIASTVVFVHAFHFMPMRPGDQSVQQAWLQEFAWLEADLDAAMQRRARRSKAQRARLLAEPMFCFETSIKLLLWSELVYDFKEEEEEAEQQGEGLSGARALEKRGRSESDVADVDSEPQTPARSLRSGTGSRASSLAAKRLEYRALLAAAMAMYRLQHFELIYEPQRETRVLLAWSGACLVVAFRGTAGKVNALSDVKAWRVPHPPARGQWWLGRQPLVHKGFLETWQVNGLHDRVVARIEEIVAAGSVPRDDFRIYLTGHSLGGALATLAAADLQRERRLPRLAVYTYGAPRTGNHAFAAEYEALAPQTWHVINDRDAVPRAGKFVCFYKRPGQRTLINQLGDIRVRPTTLEVSIHSTGFSIKQHLMVSYLQSLWAICASQRMPARALPGGSDALDSLAADPQMRAYFATLGLDLAGLAGGREQKVVLPSLEAASAHCWGAPSLLWRLCREAGGVLRELVPGGENTAAMLSLMQDEREDAALAEARQPSHLAGRLHAMAAGRPPAPAGCVPSTKAGAIENPHDLNC